MRQLSAQEDWKSPLIPNGAGGGRMKTAWTPVLVFGAFLLLVGAFVLNKAASDPYEFAISSEIAVGDEYSGMRQAPVTEVPANADAFTCTPGKVNNIGPCRCGASKVVCTNFYPVCVHKGSNVPSSAAIATEDMCLRPCKDPHAKCGWEYEFRPAFWKYTYVRSENALTCVDGKFCTKDGEYLHYENPMIGFDDRTKHWVMNLIDKEYTDPQSKAYHELYTMPCNKWKAEFGGAGAYINKEADKEQYWKCQETTSPPGSKATPGSKANLLPEDSFAVMIWGDNPINMGGHSGMLANVRGLGMYFVDWGRMKEAGAPAQKGRHMLKGPDVIFVIKNAGIDVAEWKQYNVWASADSGEQDNAQSNSNCARNVKKGLRTSAFGKANIARFSHHQWAKGVVNAVGIKQGSFYTPWYVARQLTWCVKNPSSCTGEATVTLYKRPDMSEDYFHDRYDYYSSIYDATISRMIALKIGSSGSQSADTSNVRYEMHKFRNLQQGQARMTSCDGVGAVSNANIEGATFEGSPIFAYKFSEITDRIVKTNRCMAACDGSTTCKFLQFSCSSSECFCELYSACDQLTRNNIPSAASHRVWEKKSA